MIARRAPICLTAILSASWTLAPLHAPASGASLTPGNFVIVTQDYVPGTDPSKFVEMSPSGTVVQTIPIPRETDGPARDLVVDGEGLVHVFNGTFVPTLSTYDPLLGTWSHHGILGWSTVNNGGIAATDAAVFVTDQVTDGGGSPSGVVRFSQGSYAASRFLNGKDYIDLTLGLDGLLYALGPGGSPGGTMLDVYNPGPLALVRTVQLPFGLSPRGVAVDASGRIFTVGFDQIRRFSPLGSLQKATTVNALVGDFRQLFDIDIDSAGRLVMGGGCGEIVLSDSELDPAQSRLIFGSYCFPVFTTWVTSDAPTPALPATWGRIKARYR